MGSPDSATKGCEQVWQVPTKGGFLLHGTIFGPSAAQSEVTVRATEKSFICGNSAPVQVLMVLRAFAQMIDGGGDGVSGQTRSCHCALHPTRSKYLDRTK